MALANSYSKQPAPQDTSTARSKAAMKSRTGHATLQYQRAQVETASPTRLVIMLYEGCMRFCQLALDAMDAKDLSGQHENLLKAQRIIAELLGSLNHEKGGEVAENLGRVYPHMLEQLVSANLYDQPEPVQRVLSMLRELWASWIEVERLAEQGAGNREQGTEGKTTDGVRNVVKTGQAPPANPSRLGKINA